MGVLICCRNLMDQPEHVHGVKFHHGMQLVESKSQPKVES